MIIQGEALEKLKTLPSNSVDCCVTSPPYFQLRDYGVEGQIGLEKTVDEYIEKLVDIFREVRRVLKSDGTLWVNIADSYAGSGKGKGQTTPLAKIQATNKGILGTHKHELIKPSSLGMKPKDLMGIPWLLALALRADGWYLRQDIIWHKPNPMPESVTDRCTKSHEYIFLLSKSAHYYFDYKAIEEPVVDYTSKRFKEPIEQTGEKLPRYGGKKYTEHPDKFYRTKSGHAYDFRPTRRKRDVWDVTTKPYKGAHFATFPKDLIEPCILAGSRVGGTVLDPFAGSGTTGEVAKENGRDFILIELSPEYIPLIERRIGGGGTQINLFNLGADSGIK